MEPIIRVDKLHFDYGRRRARGESPLLDGLTFDVFPGEILGIVGPNGCGKSTLISLLSNVLKPCDGEVFLRGQSLARMPQRDVAQVVAVLPQAISISFHYSVEDMVLMGRAPYRSGLGWATREDYRIADEAMDLTCTREFAACEFLELSGGEQCRVLLARALTQRPDVLLLDEPTGNLDLRYQTRMLDMLAGYAREHRSTVCIVTHDLNLAGEYCHRILALSGGKVYCEGAPADVIRAETIAAVYGADVHIDVSPHSGAPHVFLKAGAPRAPSSGHCGREESSGGTDDPMGVVFGAEEGKP